VATDHHVKPIALGALAAGSTTKVPLAEAMLSWQPRSVVLRHDRDQAPALRGALVGATGLLLVALLPADASLIAQVGMLLALWLCFGSILIYAARQRTSSPARRPSSIPLRFSGPMGRFTLRRRGDGRHVEIVAEGVVLAEVKATDRRDEIELRETVSADELEDLGSALGQAIEIASDADDAHLDWDDHGASADWEADQPGSKTW
jgi:hypothetical protein